MGIAEINDRLEDRNASCGLAAIPLQVWYCAARRPRIGLFEALSAGGIIALEATSHGACLLHTMSMCAEGTEGDNEKKGRWLPSALIFRRSVPDIQLSRPYDVAAGGAARSYASL